MLAQSILQQLHKADGHHQGVHSFAKSISYSNVNGVEKENITEQTDGQKPMSEDFIMKDGRVYSAHPQKIFEQPNFNLRMPELDFPMPQF